MQFTRKCPHCDQAVHRLKREDVRPPGSALMIKKRYCPLCGKEVVVKPVDWKVIVWAALAGGVMWGLVTVVGETLFKSYFNRTSWIVFGAIIVASMMMYIGENFVKWVKPETDNPIEPPESGYQGQTFQQNTPKAATPVTAYVALGANLGDAPAAVRRALDDLAGLPRTQLTARSSLWRSAPVEASGPDFINAVAELHTGLNAPDLLYALQGLEDAAGRQRPYPNAPRTLDLDLLCYGDERIDSAGLQVPHPRMMERAFVLRPLAEIAPRLVSAAALAAVAGQAIERVG